MFVLEKIIFVVHVSVDLRNSKDIHIVGHTFRGDWRILVGGLRRL